MICNELCFCFCPGADCAETVKIVDLKGLPSKELAAEIVFDFPIETLGNSNIQSPALSSACLCWQLSDAAYPGSLFTGQCAGFLEARPQRKEFPFGGGEYLHIWQAESFACYVAEFTNLSHVILNGR